METIAIVLSIIFTVLSFIHLYWAVGGTWGIDQALPTTVSGTRMMNPGFWGTLAVSLGLGVFAWFYYQKSHILPIHWPQWLINLAQWIIPSIFFLRAIGDFKFVGLFKKVKTTPFARMDTILYVPLCLIITILGVWINILK